MLYQVWFLLLYPGVLWFAYAGMDERVRQLRATVEALRQESAPKATRFSAAFREQVIALAKERRSEGTPLVRTASELGLHVRTIGRWLRGTSQKAEGTAPKRHFLCWSSGPAATRPSWT